MSRLALVTVVALAGCPEPGDTEVPDDRTTAERLAGTTWQVDDGATLAEPPGYGALFFSTFGGQPLVAITAADGDDASLLVARERLGELAQEPCAPTLVVPAQITDTAITTSIAALEVPLPEDHTATLREVAFTADLDVAERTFGSGVLALEVDTRDWVHLVHTLAEEDLMCVETLPDLGLACEACRDGSGDFCLPLRIEGLSGRMVNADITAIESPFCEEETALCACSAPAGAVPWPLLGLLPLLLRRRGDE